MVAGADASAGLRMRRRAFALQPIPNDDDVAAQDLRRFAHVYPQRAIDGRMADPKTKNESSISRVGQERSALRTDVRMTQIDIGNPRSNGDALMKQFRVGGGGNRVRRPRRLSLLSASLIFSAQFAAM